MPTANANAIAQHLPFLRRFSRALCGSQESGDNYVAAMLETLINDEGQFQLDDNPRKSLFGALLSIWSSFDVNLKSDSIVYLPDGSEKNLQAIAPLPRQAFLLRELEDFSSAEIADILNMAQADVEDLLLQAEREIADQVRTSVLIIEDEPLIAMDIEDMVTDLGHRVTAIARTKDEALKKVQEQKPGIILADIQLADGSSGIDAVNEILSSVNVPVIFITAYPERLLTGKRPEPAYLVTKPFQPSNVAALISQALFFSENAAEAA